MTRPRVRFAPSPTGYLHIGGARTALFNWLWARKTGGTFILRIEDTDQARSTRESVEAIFEAMRWLGMDWDEGPRHPDDLGGGPHAPYFQMKRLDLYRAHAERLIAQGNAYRCYHTPEEIEAEKAKLPPRKQASFRHDCVYRDRPEERDAPYVVRFKSPREGTVVFHDLVFGEIETPNEAQTDFILLRSDGVPLYNFGAVVDDVQMGITLVARGRDHIVNTAPQILLYQAFGYPVPQFAHLPMMMANKHEKLSKRTGTVSVTEYRDKGWLPEGLISYLVRFGWSYGDEEIFTLEDLIAKFDWDRVGKSDGIYDFKKCVAINQKYIAKLATNEELKKRVVPFLQARGLAVREDHPRLSQAIATVRERSETLVAMAEAMDFYFRAQPVMDEKARARVLVPEAAPLLEKLAAALEKVDPFGEAEVKAAVEAWLASEGLEIKTVAQPARVALTGRTASPGLYEMMAVLGREVTVFRLRAGAEMARAGGAAQGGAT
jgi:glutamyl-tRNA synthetase